MPSPPLADLLAAARAWAADDPDAVTRAPSCDGPRHAPRRPATRPPPTELADAMSGMLEFGTAGLRGRARRRPQPDEPGGRHPGGGRPHGVPARPSTRSRSSSSATTRRTNSDVFAHDTAPWSSALGGQALGAAPPAADAGAGVRDPAPRRGRRRHGHRVAQPAARTTATRSTSATARRSCRPSTRRSPPRSRRSPSVASVRLPDDGWHTLDDSVLDAYLDDVRTVVLPDSPRDVTVVHTALHGVGSETVRQAFLAAGFAGADPGGVAGRARPDVPDGRRSPTPRSRGRWMPPSSSPSRPAPDVVIANDPDADRCAVAVPGPGGWRMLRGDEVGALLGSHVLSRGAAGGVVPDSADCVFANSIVSSRLLAAMCRAAGRAPRGDADRVQVDRPGAGAALRLRGGARLLRRPAPGCATRTASRPRCSSPSSSRRSRRRGARSSTCSTTSPASTGCTPPTRSRCGSRTCR